jgi:hypothetical protein
MRVCDEQLCPEFRKQLRMVADTARSRLADSKMMLADFPPNSRETRLTVALARWATRRPVIVEPVKLMASIPAWLAKASPASWPSPVTRFNTPGGKSTRTAAATSA